ncbi:hypothetical protein B0J11DRAFT_588213 [Dendryphion nanum]|uniref:Uncharacterized protein n=1 Tax=Dendryphion nanum TaxID=256645 RepID=A0A9P9EIA4_9PLEO|nr:hypothetical protein B0J11DRAFT_588213 [Dendryphion nanum]
MNATELLPWGWTITAKDTSLVTCPSAARVLGTFAIVNVLVTILGVLFGNRYVLHRLACGKYFKDKNSKAHRLMWLVNVGIQLGANALVGAIIQRAPGYNANFKIWELMLFFTVRPRLSWIILMVLGLYENKSPQKQGYRAPAMQEATELTQYPPEHSRDNDSQEQKPAGEAQLVPNLEYQRDCPWASAAKSQAYAEIALQIIALYIMGRTVHFAAKRQYYIVGSQANKSLPGGAKLMYAGALYYLVLGVSLHLYEIQTLATHYTGLSCGQVFASAAKSGNRRHERYATIAFVFYNLSYTWLGSWLFWVGFVRLAGHLYCPPKLYAQGLVWAAFSLFGIVIGASGG